MLPTFLLRRGVLHSEDLQEEYGDDVKFLLARLTLLSEDDSVSLCVDVPYSIYFWQPLVSK